MKMDWQALDVPWEDRAPKTEVFERRRRVLLDHGMLATVSAWRSDGLIGLRIDPEKPLMKEPPNRGTPWHVSVAFEPVEPRLYEAFLHHWARPRRVRLQFSKIGWNAVATLDPQTDPIAKDPVVRRMHEDDPYYGHKPLHITF